MLRSSLLFVFALLPVVAIGVELPPMSMVRVELNPDAATVNGTCTDDLKDSLTSEALDWFNLGVSNYQGADFNEDVEFDMTAYKVDNIRNLQGEQDERDLAACSLFTCTSCCKTNCLVLCGCRLCGGSRRLRRATHRQVQLSSLTDNAKLNAELSTFFTFSVRTWLQSNDPDHCLGNPWKLAANVTIVPN